MSSCLVSGWERNDLENDSKFLRWCPLSLSVSLAGQQLMGTWGRVVWSRTVADSHTCSWSLASCLSLVLGKVILGTFHRTSV